MGLLYLWLLVITALSCYTKDADGCVKYDGTKCETTITIPDATCVAEGGFSNAESTGYELNIHFTGTNKVAIKKGAFNNTLFISFMSDAGIASLGESSFEGTGIDSIDLKGVTIVPAKCFSMCTALSTISNTKDIIEIGDEAFNGVPATTFEFAESMTKIGAKAFYSSMLTEIKLPSVITTIGSEAFSYAPDLATVDVNNNENIGEKMFAGCSAESVTFLNTESIKTIETDAFLEVTITKLHLKNVTSIGDTLATVSTVFFHGAIAPTFTKDLSTIVAVYVNDIYTATTFGTATVKKAQCDKLHKINLSGVVDGKVNGDDCAACESKMSSVDGVSDECSLDMTACINDHANCEICIDSVCESCVTGNKMTEDTKKCVATCPEKYYTSTSDNMCKKCTTANCATCDGDGKPDVCITCTDGTTADPTTHLCATTTCGTGKYGTPPDCKDCVALCDVCSDGTSCTTCKATNKKTEDTHLCYATCPATYYTSTADNMCKKCTATNCDTCENNPKCQKCSKNYLLLETTQLCVASCTNNFYEVGQECKKCLDHCSKCTDATSCTTPEDNYYYDAQTKKMELCTSDCAKCNGKEQCSVCKTGFLLEQVTLKCVSECKTLGYYKKDDSNCYTCKTNCDQCKDGDTCTVCNSKYEIYFENNCIEKCPVQYFKPTDKKTCEKCKETYKDPCDETDEECKQCMVKNPDEGTFGVAVAMILVIVLCFF
ncbi:hypothetical protein EIN_289490 [Entamoeba invadens IP1]|uniref:Surface antigen BspA-like n=1 Tax=Entamoeba invadens IP1 TaxID=370355 RepID=L7FMP6_ENTIV|nr:hypothetical protein EIN_289490 [Entamoeba invadens IP1]ELP86677.1 hypothetical protein EIN_289490 [Entamoeba invadens IP1]|eukprot:XP_004186023.1 hypothetical protein EIN_289490 [Entamoeba invadens IP1]